MGFSGSWFRYFGWKCALIGLHVSSLPSIAQGAIWCFLLGHAVGTPPRTEIVDPLNHIQFCISNKRRFGLYHLANHRLSKRAYGAGVEINSDFLNSPYNVTNPGLNLVGRSPLLHRENDLAGDCRENNILRSA